MFESPAVAAEPLAELIAAVNALDGNVSDAGLIDQIGALEHLKSSCAAAQARLTHTFTASQTADGAARKIDPDRTRRSIGAQIALARRDSRFNGSRHLGAAHALVTEMPHTLAALSAGEVSERRVRIILEQFGCLTPEVRRTADAIIAPELPSLGDRNCQSRAAGIAYKLDPEAAMGKIRGAVKDRHVSLRPAPETMTRLSALLPVAQGVAVYAALSKATDNSIAVGDGRSRGQIMADTLVSKITGQDLAGCDPYGVPNYPTDTTTQNSTDTADVEGDITVHTNGPDENPAPAATNNTAARTSATTGAGLNVNLIMTDRTLLGDDDEPAHLHGYGSIPAPLARALVLGDADTTTTTWIRRLYTNPTGTQLMHMDSTARLFPPNAKKFLIARDHTCRTPWCDAPIRHLDHVNPHSRGGPTHISNGQGLCEACNHAKQAPDWSSRVTPDGTIATTTPTGHTYHSPPPHQPRSTPWADISHAEHRLAQVILLDAA